MLVIIGYFFMSSNKKPIFKINALSVKLSQVIKRNIPITAKSNGTIIAPNKVDIKSQTNGVVKNIDFYGGELVQKNAMMLQLINTKQKADVNASEAAYTQAKLQYERYKTLYNSSKAVTLEELDNVKSVYLQAKAKSEADKYALSLTNIRAPFSGVSSVTSLAPGSYVSEGDLIAELVDRVNLTIEYNLPENLASMIKLGQEVDFYSDSYNTIFKAYVTYISPTVNQDNLTFTIRAKYHNLDGKLSPGMSVQVNQILKSKNMTLAVPEPSVYTTSGGFVVYTIKNSKAKQVKIKIGGISEGFVTVKSGLKLGDKVIVATNGVIGDGSVVKVEK